MEDGKNRKNAQDDVKENGNPSPPSAFLKEILGGRMTINDFFTTVWQQKAVVFPFMGQRPLCHSYDGSWNDEAMKSSILKEIVHQGWSLLIDILHQSEREQAKVEEKNNNGGSGTPAPGLDHQVPIIFHNLQPLPREDIEELYGQSVFGPYLNGCSIVINHGDLLSPWIAAVCNDLQASLPHAYANCYLTPPNSQAVPAHADDRDVLVVQLVGSKNWQVFQNVPVPYPYPHEQVGKDGIPVPSSVLDGPMAISTTLQPGDVLYMPRGFVHQAQCSDSLSFHMTVALATHDWSLAGMMTMATKSILSSVVEYRKSILPVAGCGDNVDEKQKQLLQRQIDEAFTRVKSEVNAGTILRNLSGRIENHNRRSFQLRMRLIHRARFPSADDSRNGKIMNDVGKGAAEMVTLDTMLRAATMEERASVETGRRSTKPRGLNVREEIADAIISIVTTMKSNPNTKCRVKDFASMMPSPNAAVCDLSLLSLAKQSVELGAMAIVH